MPHDIDTHRIKQLTSNYYTDAQQQQHQQNQLPPQQINHGQPAPGQQQQNQQHREQHPILRNAVQLPEDVILHEPAADSIDETYTRIGVTLEDKQRRAILTESRKRFNTQEQLAAKAQQQLERPEDRINLSIKDAIKLSDSSLVKNFGKYAGQDRYLFLRYSLLSNRYYALLPEDATFKLSREELIRRLTRLYAADENDRDAELITFYETIIRIKDIENAAKEEPQAPPVPNAPAITDAERRKNRSFLTKNERVINESGLSQEEKNSRLLLMRRIMSPGDGVDAEFLQESSIHIDDDQKEGMRQILAWMYRNCCKTSESKIPFVHKLASSKPEQILLAFYLVEKGLQSEPRGDEFYAATHGYVPNLAAFKGKMVASKLKFWKRIGFDSQDDVINWSILGNAVRYATNSGEAENPSDIVNYERYTGHITRLNEQIAGDAPNSVEKRNHLIELLQHKGNLILTYYRSAGMTTDMPVDMLPNTDMRTEVNSLLEEITQNLQEVYEISQQQADVQYANVGRAKDAPVNEPDPASEVIEALGNVVKPMSAVTAANIGMGIAAPYVSAVKDLMETAGFTAPTLSLNGVAGVIGVLLALSNIVNLYKTSSGLSAADKTAQIMQVGGSFANSLGMGTQTGTTIVGKFVDLGQTVSTNAPKYGTLNIRSAGEAFDTVSGGIQYVTGCVSMVTGTVMTVAGGIQIGRAVSSRNDLKRSKRALDAKGEHLSNEEKQLRAFLNHQKKAVSDQKKSGIMQTFSGALTAIGGFLTMTGILAPIGSGLTIVGIATGLGFGMIHARHKKNHTIKATVDENLKITDAAIREAKENREELAHKSDSKVREFLRQEKLAELGFATYKECFAHYMKQFAVLLYDQVMNKQGSPDWNMYYDALKSLGMKVKLEKKTPTASAIYAKLMK